MAIQDANPSDAAPIMRGGTGGATAVGGMRRRHRDTVAGTDGVIGKGMPSSVLDIGHVEDAGKDNKWNG